MDKNNIIKSISTRGNGEIYLGVVGAVRTGKSTFIKKVIENLVVPNIDDEFEKKRCLDEIPQSGAGKAIMTTEPKFVPSSGTEIKIENFKTNIKLIDCVGYVIDGASGYEDEMGNPRMVKTPWSSEDIPFVEAAEIGTKKVIEDHATIGIVVTTDGSFGEIKRGKYIQAESRVINELKAINKPFIVIMNSSHPSSSETISISKDLEEEYKVPVLPLNIETMSIQDIYDVLKLSLMEFPINDICVDIPDWVDVLPQNNEIKHEFITKIKESMTDINKLKDTDNILNAFNDCTYIENSYISNLDAGTGIVTLKMEASDELYRQELEKIVGKDSLSKGAILKMFIDSSSGEDETKSLKEALKMARKTGYGILYPKLKDMKLDKPEIIKQGSRYGVRLKAVASSIHLVKVDVESTFEPIIGSEKESKDLVDYLMKDGENNPNSIWESEIFGRSLHSIVREGIEAKLAMMPENTRYKLGTTMTKIVNKGSNNLIAVVF